MGVMILDDGKMNLTEKSLELWLFEDLLEQLSQLLYAIRKMVRIRLRVEGMKLSGMVVLPFINLLILIAATATKFTCQGLSNNA